MPFTADEIANATGCPQRNVAASWPSLITALDEFSIDSDRVQAAVAATIAVETGVFLPVRERHADPLKQPDIWALQARYWESGYMGRGFIQLTWKSNYEKYGRMLGIDLVGNPDLAQHTMTASRVLAAFFKVTGAAHAADDANWEKVRKIVNGGVHGLEPFLKIIKRLGV